MGNLCGKPSSSKDNNFAGPGRVLGSAPAQPSKASVPVTARKVGGPPRTLGGEGGTPQSGGQARGDSDPRSAAAAAAEARAKKTPTGDLARKLDAQKRQTHAQTLQSAAAENLAHRQADEAFAARNHN
ncbi:uncharacterized protein EI97DRAFT_448330 [Westerdykella ornata]|uniref:Uncharacterized protein n=1 Tax=Westerdykella ornata TaxID=318751 RepID=A0A6A6JUZ6_WESOR|nr:uncharacterized protein EI97DRAFT_448330 [Westerdykella ornata]KAF2279638.1 hypothetical protein EI97DRAFT_448330 [Westerdykella ornata]